MSMGVCPVQALEYGIQKQASETSLEVGVAAASTKNKIIHNNFRMSFFKGMTKRAICLPTSSFLSCPFLGPSLCQAQCLVSQAFRFSNDGLQRHGCVVSQSDLFRATSSLSHLCDIPALEHIQPQHKNDGILKLFLSNFDFG